jgi:hypothetical protein
MRPSFRGHVRGGRPRFTTPKPRRQAPPAPMHPGEGNTPKPGRCGVGPPSRLSQTAGERESRGQRAAPRTDARRTPRRGGHPSLAGVGAVGHPREFEAPDSRRRHPESSCAPTRTESRPPSSRLTNCWTNVKRRAHAGRSANAHRREHGPAQALPRAWLLEQVRAFAATRAFALRTDVLTGLGPVSAQMSAPRARAPKNATRQSGARGGA